MLRFRAVLSTSSASLTRRSQPVSDRGPHAPPPRPHWDSKTEDWRLTNHAVDCRPASTRRRPAVALRDRPNLFWLRDWDWPLLNEYLHIYIYIYIYIMSTDFWFPTWASYTHASLFSCLHRCVLQSLCLHCWNIRLR